MKDYSPIFECLWLVCIYKIKYFHYSIDYSKQKPNLRFDLIFCILKPSSPQYCQKFYDDLQPLFHRSFETESSNLMFDLVSYGVTLNSTQYCKNFSGDLLPLFHGLFKVVSSELFFPNSYTFMP